MRGSGLLVLAVLSALLVGCSDEAPAPPAADAAPPAAVPTYDAALEPSAAVLALVPQAATVLTVTDFDEVRDDLGLQEVTTASSAEEQAAFWAQADAGSALLAGGLLRPDATALAALGVSQTAVAWEAHFFDGAGTELGWVLGLRPGTDPLPVRRAIEAGTGPLAGAQLRPEKLLVLKGAAPDGSSSWATDDDTRALVGLPAVSTYVERACVPDDAAPPGLDDLAQYSLQLEGGLATARLGPGREDLFARLRLAQSLDTFSRLYGGGVADPLTGRLGFVMTDPPAAAELALRGTLPFAACPTS